MKRLPGQALRGCRRVLHLLAEIAIALAVLAGIGTAVLGWRLSQGPLDIGWLARRIEVAVNADGGPTRFSIGAAGLAWEGFARGVDRPLDIRLRDVAVTEPSGIRLLDIPRAELSISLHALLLGRVVPRAVQVDGLRLALMRAADGSLALDLGSLGEGTDSGAPPALQRTGPDPLAGLLAELARPAQTDRTAARRSRISQLSRVRLRNLAITVVDPQLGATWRIPDANVDLRRGEGGGVQGTAEATLALGEKQTHIDAVASLAAGGSETQVDLSFSPVSPVALAAAAPRLKALAALDAPVSGRAELQMRRGLVIRHASLDLSVGAGKVHVDGSTVPLDQASIALDADPSGLRLRAVRLVLPGHPGGQPTTLSATGRAWKSEGRMDAHLALDLDQVAFADLSRLWPAGIGDDVRSWLTENITAGVAHDGHAELDLSASPDLSEVALTGATGTLAGDDVTVYWLRPVPPIDHGVVALTIVNPDEIDLAIKGGQQGRLRIGAGSIRFTGLAAHDQVAEIQGDISGSVADAIALLRQPRLKLLSAHPIDLRDPAGDVAVNLRVTLPLEKNVSMEQVPIVAEGRLTRVHLTGMVVGRDIDGGNLALKVDTDGLTLTGNAAIGGIPTTVSAAMDFRAGPPAQVVERMTATARTDGTALARAGLELPENITGTMAAQADVALRRNGQGDVTVNADLADAAVSLKPLAWSKSVGAPGKATLRLRLDRDRIVGVDELAFTGEGLSIHASGTFPARGPRVLTFDRFVAGETRAQGSLRLPAPGEPIRVTLDGPVADLSSTVSRKAKPAKEQPEKPGAPFIVVARFGRVLVGRGTELTNVSGELETDGVIYPHVQLTGATGPGAPFSLTVDSGPGGQRRLSATATDAGALLRAFDIVGSMRGGALKVDGTFDDKAAGHPLTGTATIDDFRVVDAPALARLLQAMTLYGLVDTMRGPGLGFSHLIAPFRLDASTLQLNDARAFNNSLGLTAKGSIDLVGDTLDMQGTIVPAYFFNSLLGHVPLIGKLFSPERGGGLFAASYTVHGSLADPSVSVNPLAALTPGFLRGVFGIFDGKTSP